MPLLALQTVGVTGKVSNTVKIEPRQNAFALAAILKVARPQALALEAFDRTELLKHIQGRRMKRRCPGLRTELITALEHGHRNAASKQSRRRRHPYRPGARYEYAFFSHRHMFLPALSCTTCNYV